MSERTNRNKISDVKITVKNYRNFSYNNPLYFKLEAGISFILGVNNIGKSNILRFFYEFRDLVKVDQPPFYKSNFHLPVNFSSIKNQVSEKDEILFDFETENQIYKGKITPKNNADGSECRAEFKVSGKNGRNGYLEDFQILTEIFRNSMYIGSFRSPLSTASGNYFDIKVGSTFIKTWSHWANGSSPTKRKKIKDLTKELKRLFAFKELQVAVSEDKTNLIMETESGSSYLNELGGGVGHFILLLGNAIFKNPSFILIDEPENALHPQLQEVFVRILASKAEYGLIATSHSIGLARSSSDKIYSLIHTENRTKLMVYGQNHDTSIFKAINELGYSQFVEIGGNNILLVEGRTDIKCFKEILRKYDIEQHFIIMDIGGSSMISSNSYDELNELKRLNAKSYNVIVDSEISAQTKKPKKQILEFESMCKRLGFNVFLTEFHSTENYISQQSINDVFGNKFKALEKYEDFEKREKQDKWAKKINWKMFREMKVEDFHKTKLDSFIKEKLIPLATNNNS